MVLKVIVIEMKNKGEKVIIKQIENVIEKNGEQVLFILIIKEIVKSKIYNI